MGKKITHISIANKDDADISNLLELALSTLKYSKEQIIHYTFLVEEALACWKEKLPGENTLSLTRIDTPHTVRFEFRLPGEKTNPFIAKQKESEGFSMEKVSQRLLSGVGSELRYSYKKGENVLTLVLPKDHIDSRIFRYNVVLLTIPLTLQTLLSSIASNIDTLMLGFQGSTIMAGVSLASSFITLPTVLLGSVVFASSSLLSQYWGKRDLEGTRQIQSLSVAVALFIALLFSLATLLFPSQIMGFYSADKDIVQAGADYLRWISPSFLFSAIYLTIFCFMQSTGGVKKALRYAIIGCVFNVLFNAVLIFGLFGIPSLGAKGAAISTVLSAAIQAILASIDFHKSAAVHFKFYFHYSIGFKSFFLCFLAISAQRFSWNLANNFISAAIGHMSPDIVSANSLLLVLSGFVLSLKSGFGKGVGLQMGAYLGKEKFDIAKNRANDAQKFGAKAALLLVPIFVLVGFSFTFLPMKLSDGAIHWLTIMLAIYSVNIFFSFMNGLQNQGFLYAGGDTKAILIIDTIVMWGVMVPISLLSVHTNSLPILFSLIILEWSEVISFPLKFFRVKQGKWLKNLTRDKTKAKEKS